MHPSYKLFKQIKSNFPESNRHRHRHRHCHHDMQLEDRSHFAIPEPAWISISKTSSRGHQSNSPTIIYSSIQGQQSPSESNSRQSSKGENCKTSATILMRVAAAPVNLGSLLKLQAISRPKFGGKNSTIKNRISCSSSYSTVADMSGSGSDQGLSAPRLVVKKFLAEAQKEGDGATVRRSIGRPGLKYFDPFLLLDEFTVSAPAGFPDHPHRGFETVTYMFQGAFTHQDFAGHKGTIGTGDLQWMTAGRGIVHSEMPAAAGVNWGLQLWVNLASKDKMCEPRYQELPSSEITRAEKDGIEVRVIAGEGMGVKSPVFTRTPAMFLDFTLQPGASVSQPIPESYNAFVYTVEGEGIFGVPNSAPVPAHNCLVLGPGDGLSVWNNSSEPLRFVLIGGQPIGEPVVQYGPFVMNTQAEIQKAFEDYQHGKNGFEKARYWRSHSH